MSKIDPAVQAALEERVANLDRDAAAWHSELQVRAAAAGERMNIDAEFSYKVLLLTSLKMKTQPGVHRGILLKMSIMDVLVLELADEHIRGEAGVA